MNFAIELAKSVKGQTTPNPPVGAVIVNNGAIIGFGAHLKNGEDHAEIAALKMAKNAITHATLYVTLEPCSHFGKTPPCTNAIIESGIVRVVIACLDKNKKVRGIQTLENAGIKVEVGLLKEEAQPLYDVFFHNITKGLPYVTLKTAMSLDGKTATKTGESKWITNELARKDGHYYRHINDAILVGVNTVICDNPSLTTRMNEGRNPIRIILDTHLRTPIHSKVIHDNQSETWIFTNNCISAEQKKIFLDKPGMRIITLESATVKIKSVLEFLLSEGIATVLVEGGATINDAFLQTKSIDKLICYIAPSLIGGQGALSSFSGVGFDSLDDSLNLQITKTEMLDGNIKIIAERKC